MPPKGYTNPTLQLFVMDEDGANVTPIAPMNIGERAAPDAAPRRPARCSRTLRERRACATARMWGIWAIWPDGRRWEPVVSAFRERPGLPLHDPALERRPRVVDYYNLNNNGFGALYRMPVRAAAGRRRASISAFLDDNPPIAQTVGGRASRYPFRMPFTPRGLYSLTPFTHGNDEAAPVGAGGVRVGKFTHPSAAPDNDLLVVWTPGPGERPRSPDHDARTTTPGST